jgi:hypothetical protein
VCMKCAYGLDRSWSINAQQGRRSRKEVGIKLRSRRATDADPIIAALERLDMDRLMEPSQPTRPIQFLNQCPRWHERHGEGCLCCPSGGPALHKSTVVRIERPC